MLSATASPAFVVLFFLLALVAAAGARGLRCPDTQFLLRGSFLRHGGHRHHHRHHHLLPLLGHTHPVAAMAFIMLGEVARRCGAAQGATVVRDTQKISAFPPSSIQLDNGDRFGKAIASLADFDGDSVPDICVGAVDDDDGGLNCGAVYVLFLNSDGTVKASQKISATQGGLTESGVTLDAFDRFGSSIAPLGDLDGDSVADICVGARFDDDGGLDSGAVYVLFLNSTDGTVKSAQKISAAAAGGPSGITVSGFGVSATGLGDLDGDGVTEICVGADAVQAGPIGGVFVLFLARNGTVGSVQVIPSATSGFPAGALAIDSGFGYSAAALGDLDGDSVTELCVGAFEDDDGGVASGAVYVLFLARNGSAHAAQKISSKSGGLPSETLDTGDRFGASLAALGDYDGDGVNDVCVGASRDDDAGNNPFSNRGAVHILLLANDGTVKATQKISATTGGLKLAVLGDQDRFGNSIAALDLDGDSVVDLAVGAYLDDDGGSGTCVLGDAPVCELGAVYVLFLNNGFVATAQNMSSVPSTGGNSTQKISALAPGFPTGVLKDYDLFGTSTSSIGDIDGDGSFDICVGVIGDDDGGVDSGAVYVLFLTRNGTVKSVQKISSTSGGLPAGTVKSGDRFGISIGMVGDLDRDGVNDICVGASRDDDGGTNGLDSNVGAVYLLFLTRNGTAKSAQKISSASGGLPAGTLANKDRFGSSVAALGLFDGEGATEVICVGADGDNDFRGAVYILFLASNWTVKSTQKISSTTGLPVNTLDPEDLFGISVAAVGDIDGDSVTEICVGADQDDDGDISVFGSAGFNRGALYVLFLARNGTVKSTQKISAASGGLPSGTLSNGDQFGRSIASLGDVDGDSVPDVCVGAVWADDGGSGSCLQNVPKNCNRGAVYVLFLARDGTARETRKISLVTGDLPAGALDDLDEFGRSLAVGDFNGDAVLDIIAGACKDDDGGTDFGALYIVFLSNDSATAPNVPPSTPPTPTSSPVTTASRETRDSYTSAEDLTIVIAVISAVAVLILVLCFAVLAFLVLRRRNAANKEISSSSSGSLVQSAWLGMSAMTARKSSRYNSEDGAAVPSSDSASTSGEECSHGEMVAMTMRSTAGVAISAPIGTHASSNMFHGSYHGSRVAVRLVARTTAVRTQLEVWSKLNHPNVIQLHGVCCSGDLADENGLLQASPGTQFAAVTEWCSGGSLRSVLQNTERADQKQLNAWVTEALAAVSYAVSEGVTVRGIQADSFLVGSDDTLRFAGFCDLVMASMARAPAWAPPEKDWLPGASEVHLWATCAWQILSRCAHTPWEAGQRNPGENAAGGQRSSGSLDKTEAGTETRGSALHQPDACGDELFALLKLCWSENPADRPSFATLQERMDAMVVEEEAVGGEFMPTSIDENLDGQAVGNSGYGTQAAVLPRSNTIHHSSETGAPANPVYHNKRKGETEPVYHNKREEKMDPVYHNKRKGEFDPVYHNKNGRAETEAGGTKIDPEAYLNRGSIATGPVVETEESDAAVAKSEMQKPARRHQGDDTAVGGGNGAKGAVRTKRRRRNHRKRAAREKAVETEESDAAVAESEMQKPARRDQGDDTAVGGGNGAKGAVRTKRRRRNHRKRAAGEKV